MPAADSKDNVPFRYDDGFIVLKVARGKGEVHGYFRSEGVANHNAEEAFAPGAFDVYVIPVSKALRHNAGG